MSKWEIREGHVLDRLREMPAGSIQTCITSPPYYNLRDYDLPPSEWGDGWTGCLGLEPTPDQFVAHLVEVFAEVRRVLRDDGTLWCNMGDSYASSPPGNKGSGLERYQSSGLHGAATSAKYAATLDASVSQKRDTSRLPGIKPKDLLGIPWMLAFALRADGWYLRSDIIWCLSGGAMVYARTQKGDMPIMVKDLVRLDPATVKLWNGEKWTQALGWSRSPEPRDGALEITLRSGERIGCTRGHEWPTQRGNVRADEFEPGDIIQTCRLPEPDAVYAPAHVDGEVAWLAGLYLAEGSRDSRDRLQFAGHTNQNAERAARVAPIVAAFGGTLAVREDGNRGNLIVDCPSLAAMIGQYIHGRSARTKGIKTRAWRHSDEWLRHLLAGYLAGDSHHDVANDRWRLGFTRNDRLASDLRTLAARLGCTLTLKATHGEGFGKRWPIYRGELRYAASTHHNAKDRGEVMAIGPSRARQHWDIGVEDEPHLFALASGVLTHNSKPNPMPESVTDRPTSAHEHLFLLAKSPRYAYDADAIREPWADERNGASGTKSLAYSEESGRNGDSGLGAAPPFTGRNKRNVWTVATTPFPGSHFAVFPPKLIEPCVLAGSAERACGECGAPWERVVERTAMVVREGPGRVGTRAAAGEASGSRTACTGTMLEAPTSRTVGFAPSCDHANASGASTVLDPFSGAGTTGMVAVRHGRSFVGIELSPVFAEMARERIRRDTFQLAFPDWQAA